MNFSKAVQNPSPSVVFLLNSTDIIDSFKLLCSCPNFCPHFLCSLVGDPWLTACSRCAQNTFECKGVQGTLHVPTPWNRGAGQLPSRGRFSEVRGLPKEPPSRLCCGWWIKSWESSGSRVRPDTPASELCEHGALGGTQAQNWPQTPCPCLRRVL